MVKVYEVGGCVRDYFLGKESKDIDFAVEASSYEEMKDYILSKGTIFLENPGYFTVRAKVEGLGNADFVLCRKDYHYSDGRRPDKVDIGTIFDDLSRRDFTMNAIAKDVNTGEFIDPYGGIEDINRMVIRCVGSTDRLIEDALRVLRALRFSITKEFDIEGSIDDFIKNEAELHIDNVSAERIMEELNMMFGFSTRETVRLFNKYNDFFDRVFSNKKIQMKTFIR